MLRLAISSAMLNIFFWNSPRKSSRCTKKYFSAQSAGRNSTSGTGSSRISSQGLFSSRSKISPKNIALSRVVAPGSPRMVEPMTSKVLSYWKDDVKMTSKVQPVAGYWAPDRDNLGTRLCYFWRAEKERNREPRRTGKNFKCIIKSSTSADNTFLDLQSSSYPTQPHSIIDKCYSNERISFSYWLSYSLPFQS